MACLPPELDPLGCRHLTRDRAPLREWPRRGTARQGSRRAATRTAVVALRTAGDVPGRPAPGSARRRTAHARGAGTTNLGHRPGPDRSRCAPSPPSRSRWLRPTRPRHDPHHAPSVMTLMAQHQPGRDRSPQVLPQHPQHRHRPLFVRVPHTRSPVLRERPEPHPAAERALLHHTDQLTNSRLSFP